MAVLLALSAGALYAGQGEGACTSGPPQVSAGKTATPTARTLALPSPEAAGAARRVVPPGMAGVTVRLADPAVAAVLWPGARVDLLAGSARDAAARDVLVLATIAGNAFDEPGAAALFVAVPQATTAQVSNVPTGTTFQVIVRPT